MCAYFGKIIISTFLFEKLQKVQISLTKVEGKNKKQKSITNTREKSIKLKADF